MDGLHRLPQLRERTSLGLDGPRWHVDQKQIDANRSSLMMGAHGHRFDSQIHSFVHQVLSESKRCAGYSCNGAPNFCSDSTREALTSAAPVPEFSFVTTYSSERGFPAALMPAPRDSSFP
jgi:hypothetical protein